MFPKSQFVKAEETIRVDFKQIGQNPDGCNNLQFPIFVEKIHNLKLWSARAAAASVFATHIELNHHPAGLCRKLIACDNQGILFSKFV